MNRELLWSLRLGYSRKQEIAIRELGIESFLDYSFNVNPESKAPDFIEDYPKKLEEIFQYRKELKGKSEKEQKKMRQEGRLQLIQMKSAWVNAMMNNDFPLREKMTCFWHNHFVATSKKIKNNYWLFQHNALLRKNAFGNFRELTKQVLYSNAMIKYLDNDDNKINKVNENLSRELLELFTLGIGNYNEADIKNGAIGLAGLSLGDFGIGKYRKHRMSKEPISYFGQTGMFRAEDLVDIIFQQKAAPYLITKKILQWFIYDEPGEDLIQYYAEYLREVEFEIKPFLKKVFLEEYMKDTSGSKIKDPLLFSLQLLHELNVQGMEPDRLNQFLRTQGMEFFNQQNVKGWEGGRAWLSSQLLLQRNQVVDFLCAKKVLGKRSFAMDKMGKVPDEQIEVSLEWDKQAGQQEIIALLSQRLLFQVDENMQEALEHQVSYDFNPQSEYAEQTVMRLFNFIAKTPEFQLI